jgi:hypothetical protein
VLLELLVLTGLKHSFDDGPSTATCRSWWADGIDEVLLWSRHRHLSFVSSLPNDSRTFLGSENGRTFLETGVQGYTYLPHEECRLFLLEAALRPALDQVEVNPVLADRSTPPWWHQLIELKCQRSRLSRKMGASIPTSDTSRSRSARAAAHVRKRELKKCALFQGEENRLRISTRPDTDIVSAVDCSPQLRDLLGPHKSMLQKVGNQLRLTLQLLSLTFRQRLSQSGTMAQFLTELEDILVGGCVCYCP